MYGKKLQGIQKIISEFVTQIKFTKKCDDQIGVPWIQKCLKTIIKNTHPSFKKNFLSGKAQNILNIKHLLTYWL